MPRGRAGPSTLVPALALCCGVAASAQEAFPPPKDPPEIRALRIEGGLAIDGHLTEVEWDRAPMATGFRQIDPRQGEPASFDTEVRILYDAEKLYVGAFCRDDLGPSGVRVRNLRRDFDSSTDDVFGVAFDTFRDGQNALVFQVNPYGARRDEQVRDGSEEDLEWDGAWQAATQRFPDGWSVEMAIPWATLRYPPAAKEWAVNFIRVLRRFNETTGWSPWPRGYTPYRMAYAGLLSELEPPPPSRNVRLQPYLAGRANRGESASDGEAAVGGDLKWAITPNTVLDATFNTDFAEADADRQVVNLTRFSVLFPEQRPFFLENGNLFAAGLERDVHPFFSRRIGLADDGTPIPIEGGLRLTHRTGQRSAGGLLVTQGGRNGVPATTFAVGRYVQNLGRENRVGAHLVSRFDEASAVPGSTNTVATLDSFLRVNPTLYVRSMLSGSRTTGTGADGLAASVDVSKEGNWGIVWLVEEYIGPGYEAATGFVTRPDIVRTNPGVNFDFRPAWKPSFVRRFYLSSVANVYHRASDGRFQEARWYVPLPGMYFERGGFFLPYLVPNWQDLDRAFSPLPGLRIEPGRYQFNRWALFASSNPSRRFGLRVDAELGPFYDGSSQVATLSGFASPTPRASLTAAYSVNVLRDIGLERADRTTHLFQPTLRLALDPRLQLTGFYQRNTAAQLSTWNVRFSWEFRPLSYVYLVYNDRRPWTGADPTMRAERQLILKVTFNRPI